MEIILPLRELLELLRAKPWPLVNRRWTITEIESVVRGLRHRRGLTFETCLRLV